MSIDSGLSSSRYYFRVEALGFVVDKVCLNWNGVSCPSLELTPEVFDQVRRTCSILERLDAQAFIAVVNAD